MYRIRIFFLLLGICFISLQSKAQDFDKETFYKVLSADNEKDIDEQVKLVKKSGIKEKTAYEGVLLMKKSGLLKKPKDKLNTFKAGHNKLEPAITADKDNIEYRFLRVLIQENAPKILGYKKELAADSQLINSNFNQLSPLLKQVITDYSKKSKTIKIPIHN
jgi:hypothetical protein